MQITCLEAKNREGERKNLLKSLTAGQNLIYLMQQDCCDDDDDDDDIFVITHANMQYQNVFDRMSLRV